jgi:hypothetical protein
MNHTFTPMAARLLKVNIISPITTEKSINERLDAVEGRIYASSACLISLRLLRTDTFRRHVQRGPISAQDARKTRPGQTDRFREYYLLPFRSAAQVPLACRLRPPDPGEIIDPNRYTHNTDVAAPQYRQKSARSAGFPEECIVDIVANHFRRESCP